MEKTTIYLPDDLRWYLRDAAQRTGKSQADLIREAIQAQREANPRPPVTIVGIGRSKSRVSASDKAAWRAEYHEHLEKKYGKPRADA